MSAGIRTTGPTPGVRAVERGESCLGNLLHTHSNCSRDAGIKLNNGEGFTDPQVKAGKVTTYLRQVRGGEGGWNADRLRLRGRLWRRGAGTSLLQRRRTLCVCRRWSPLARLGLSLRRTNRPFQRQGSPRRMLSPPSSCHWPRGSCSNLHSSWAPP